MERYVDCYAGLVEGDKMYIPGLTYSFLMEYDLNDWKQSCLLDFTDLFKELPVRAMAIFKEGDYVYLVLRNTFRILECNLKTREAIFIGEQPVYEDPEVLIIDALRIGDEIWSIPGNIQNTIQIFNIKSKRFTELSVLEQINGYENLLGFLEGAVCGDSIYLPVYGDGFSNLICQILCKEKKAKVWPLEEEVFLHTLSSCEGEIWLSNFRNSVFPELYRWECGRGVAERVCLGRCDWRARDNPWEVSFIREIIVYREKLVVIPHYSGEIIVIDKKQGSQRRLVYPVGFHRGSGSEEKEMFRGISIQKEQVFLFPCAYNGVLILNMETEELEFQELLLNKEACKKYYEFHYQEKGRKELIFFEGEALTYDRGKFFLADYIGQVEMAERSSSSGRMNTSGKRIYAYLTDGKEGGER